MTLAEMVIFLLVGLALNSLLLIRHKTGDMTTGKIKITNNALIVVCKLIFI